MASTTTFLRVCGFRFYRVTALQVLDAAGDVKLDRVLAYYAVKCCLDRAGSWPMQVLHVLLPPVLCYILHSTSTRPDVRT